MTEEFDSIGLPVYNVDFSCIFLNKRRAWTLEEYAAILSGVTPGSGRHISHNEDRNYLPILERDPYKNRYSFHLQDLQLAVSTGGLKASKDIFTDRPLEYLCLLEDFLEWAKVNETDIYNAYMVRYAKNVMQSESSDSRTVQQTNTEMGYHSNGVIMKRLNELKKWLTLPEAAKDLSDFWRKEVTVADILRLALDQHLTLSVNFVNHISATPGIYVNAGRLPDEDIFIERLKSIPSPNG